AAGKRTTHRLRSTRSRESQSTAAAPVRRLRRDSRTIAPHPPSSRAPLSVAVHCAGGPSLTRRMVQWNREGSQALRELQEQRALCNHAISGLQAGQYLVVIADTCAKCDAAPRVLHVGRIAGCDKDERKVLIVAKHGAYRCQDSRFLVIRPDRDVHVHVSLEQIVAVAHHET